MKWQSCVVIVISLCACSSTSKEFKDEVQYRFPPVFHLDNQDRCLSQPGGLYCLGSFHIQPAILPHPEYEVIKKYSELPFTFNRTIIRRGWCVSARYKSQRRNTSRVDAASGDASVQFARCGAQWGRARALTTSLLTLHYCRSHDDTLAKPTTTPEQRTFIDIVYVILILNAIGTMYDVMTGDHTRKNKLLMAWSIPANWRRLTAVYEDGDPRISSLNVLQGIKVVCMFLIMYGHASAMVYRFFTENPEHLEKIIIRLDGIILSNGTSLVHIFVAISSFLTTYNLILYSEQKQLSVSLLPLCILKRIFRLSPVNLLVIGYAATWWPYSRQGPLVSPVIGAESRHCYNKYWAQAFFVNNIVDPDDNCIAPTWFLAADFQLYILACTLTLSEGWLKRNALVIYPTLVVATSIFNGFLTYLLNYKSMIYIINPENLHSMFHGEHSFSIFYNSTWGALPACFIGMSIAHLHYEFQKKTFNRDKLEWMKINKYICIPLSLCWVLAGSYVRNYESRIISAVHVAVDRTVFVTIISIGMLAVMNIDCRYRRFFTWSGWNTMARVSLPVMLIHWIVNMCIAARPYAYNTSVFDTGVDLLATSCITYAIAIPVAVLVEIPAQKFLNALVF